MSIANDFNNNIDKTDREGYDESGYDQSGFDKNGLDEYGCNWSS